MRLIDADELTEEIRHAIKVSQSPWNHYGWFQKTVDEAPTIEPVKRGEWIAVEDDYGDVDRIQCSVCGEEYCAEYSLQELAEESHYCPNCGAKMSIRSVQE